MIGRKNMEQNETGWSRQQYTIWNHYGELFYTNFVTFIYPIYLSICNHTYDANCRQSSSSLVQIEAGRGGNHQIILEIRH